MYGGYHVMSLTVVGTIMWKIIFKYLQPKVKRQRKKIHQVYKVFSNITDCLGYDIYLIFIHYIGLHISGSFYVGWTWKHTYIRRQSKTLWCFTHLLHTMLYTTPKYKHLANNLGDNKDLGDMKDLLPMRVTILVNKCYNMTPSITLILLICI